MAPFVSDGRGLREAAGRRRGSPDLGGSRGWLTGFPIVPSEGGETSDFPKGEGGAVASSVSNNGLESER